MSTDYQYGSVIMGAAADACVEFVALIFISLSDIFPNSNDLKDVYLQTYE